MSFFGDLLYSAAPIAAGFAFPGAPILAGAATGAGIAAMRGQDPIIGAATGAFGGTTGGNLSGAAGGLGSIPNAMANPSGSQMASNALMGGSRIPSAAGATAGAGTGITSGQAFKNMVSNPGQVLSNLGDGSKLKGVGKLSATGLPAIAETMVPKYDANPDDNPMSKYDPKRRLNVGMSTGIQNALKRDSKLRLNQPFAQFAEGGYLETNMGDGMSDDIPSSIDGEQPAALSENEFVIPADVVSHLGNGSSDAGAEQLYAMMDRVRKARTGNEKQGREIMSQEYMPA